MRILISLFLFALCSFSVSCKASPEQVVSGATAKIIPAAERMEAWIQLVEGRRVAVFGNHSSLVGDKHLVDTLLTRGIAVQKIFSPEHGFRGTADAGEKVASGKDGRTGLPVISLYGQKKKPSSEDLADVDLILFDIQDVGVRFFTYISSLEDLAESAMEHHIPLLVLDRPNPNGFYVDGPVLQPAFRSFLGKQRIPVVYGMTIGEYALMLKGEEWIRPSGAAAGELQLTVIPCEGYDHTRLYHLPVKPSPNLPDMASIYLYPSTCFFEGTVISEGRGTERPFQIFGHPLLPDTLFAFTPVSRPGATKPKLLGQRCYGWDLGAPVDTLLKRLGGKLQLRYLMDAYRLFPKKELFFLQQGSAFNRLAGNDLLIRQIREGRSEAEIRASWEPEIRAFKEIRRKYLLYKDFE